MKPPDQFAGYPFRLVHAKDYFHAENICTDFRHRHRACNGHADTAFHEAFFNHCGNRYLQESYGLVGGRIAALRTSLSAPIDVQTPRSFEEHLALLRFFEAGDFAGLETLMTSHINGSGQTYANALLG